MKKTTVAFCMAFTILLSGAAGYGGAKLAGYTNPSEPAVSNQTAGTDDRFTPPDPTVSNQTAGTDDRFTPPDPLPSDPVPLAVSTLLTPAASAGRTPLTIPEIAKNVANTVVEIATERAVRYGQYVNSGAGSGVILTADGYIVTCNHVIENAGKITVRLRNGTAYEASVVGRDVKTDLAVIKINAGGLQAARFGNSDSLVVGELAVAVGNPLGQLGGTVSEGIISALDRDITIDDETMILLQTTAAVNPGNSGGALFNTYGELIGVVNAKSGGSNIEGIGFAIPVNMVKSITDPLTQFGYVPGRVDFGVSLVDVTDPFTAMRLGVSSLGVYVARTDADSGLRSGDRIVSVAGVEVRSSADIKAVYDQYKVGDTLAVTAVRNRSTVSAKVTLKQAQH